MYLLTEHSRVKVPPSATLPLRFRGATEVIWKTSSFTATAVRAVNTAREVLIVASNESITNNKLALSMMATMRTSLVLFTALTAVAVNDDVFQITSAPVPRRHRSDLEDVAVYCDCSKSSKHSDRGPHCRQKRVNNQQ